MWLRKVQQFYWIEVWGVDQLNTCFLSPRDLPALVFMIFQVAEMLSWPCHGNLHLKVHCKRNPHWNRNRQFVLRYWPEQAGGKCPWPLPSKGRKGGPKKHKVKRIYYYILFQILNPTGVPHLCPLPNWKKLGSPHQPVCRQLKLESV